MPVGVEYHCPSLFSTGCHSPAWTCSSPPALILTVEVSTSRLIAFGHIAYIRVASQIYFKLGIKTYATAEIHLPERCISEIVYCSQGMTIRLCTARSTAHKGNMCVLQPSSWFLRPYRTDLAELMAGRHASGSSDTLRKPAQWDQV